jgi:hypothetical protein
MVVAICCNCGGRTQAPAPPAAEVQFISPATGTAIDQGQSLALTVSTQSGQGVSWQLQTSTGKPIGKLANETANSATYIAPSTVTRSTPVTVVATSISNPNASAVLGITIEPPPQITSNSPTPATVGCPPPGTVISGIGSSFGTVWTAGAGALTYYLSATGGVSPYKWTLASGTLPAGLTMGTPTSSQTVIYGTPTTPGCSSVSLQLTDAAGMSVTTPYYLIVLPPSLSIQPPPLAMPLAGIPYPPTSLAATNGIPPFFWSLNPNTFLPPGLTFTIPANNPNAAAVSGTPSATGLGQSFAPSVFVYDSQLPYPAVAQANLNITTVEEPDPSCHAGSEGNLTTKAPYAFWLRGFDVAGPVVIAGNFSVDGAGNVTGGMEDIISSAGAQTNLSIGPGSSYTLGADNRGCLTLANSAGSTAIFRFALGGCSTSADLSGGCTNGGYFTRGRMLENDSASSTRATGTLQLASPSAFSDSSLSGAYAFVLSGWDAAQGRYAMAGSANAGSGKLTAISADVNDAGVLNSSLTGGAGSYGIESTGRGTGALTVGSTNLDIVLYVINNQEAIVATIDQVDATHPLLSGQVLGAAGPFEESALQGNYLVRSEGLSSGAPDPNIGVLTFDGVSSVKGTIYENDAGLATANPTSASYSVGSNARLSFATNTNQTLGPHPFVGYLASLASGVGALLISTDPSAQAGLLEFQSPTPPIQPFGNSSLTGPYILGTDENLDANTWDYVGTTSPNGNGDEAGCLCDVSGPGIGNFSANQQFFASYSVGKSGVGFFGGQSVAVTNGTSTFYIDESPLNIHPAVVVMEK